MSSGNQQPGGEIGFLSFWIQDGADYRNKKQKNEQVKQDLRSYLKGNKRKAKLGLS